MNVVGALLFLACLSICLSVPTNQPLLDALNFHKVLFPKPMLFSHKFERFLFGYFLKKLATFLR